MNYYHHEYYYGFLCQIVLGFYITFAFSSKTNEVVEKNVLFVGDNANLVTRNALTHALPQSLLDALTSDMSKVKLSVTGPLFSFVNDDMPPASQNSVHCRY